ncbi:hypothetical protein KDI_33020 [Dictyobacter arantiisoli]|uniref:Uncharacterized protein n=1 Tax=Dictyobacter arantiisoli TaxID=2014874 RepID=A0A5A5TES5_9CHLR|nr:hypothetical protein KDI_33020 [Dictyobacter arantiisoli]
MRAEAAAEVRFPVHRTVISPQRSVIYPNMDGGIRMSLWERYRTMKGKAHLGCDPGTHLHRFPTICPLP